MVKSECTAVVIVTLGVVLGLHGRSWLLLLIDFPFLKVLLFFLSGHG